MSGFEPESSGVRSDHCTTTTSLNAKICNVGIFYLRMGSSLKVCEPFLQVSWRLLLRDN